MIKKIKKGKILFLLGASFNIYAGQNLTINSDLSFVSSQDLVDINHSQTSSPIKTSVQVKSSDVTSPVSSQMKDPFGENDLCVDSVSEYGDTHSVDIPSLTPAFESGEKFQVFYQEMKKRSSDNLDFDTKDRQELLTKFTKRSHEEIIKLLEQQKVNTKNKKLYEKIRHAITGIQVVSRLTEGVATSYLLLVHNSSVAEFVTENVIFRVINGFLSKSKMKLIKKEGITEGSSQFIDTIFNSIEDRIIASATSFFVNGITETEALVLDRFLVEIKTLVSSQ